VRSVVLFTTGVERNLCAFEVALNLLFSKTCFAFSVLASVVSILLSTGTFCVR